MGSGRSRGQQAGLPAYGDPYDPNYGLDYYGGAYDPYGAPSKYSLLVFSIFLVTRTHLISKLVVILLLAILLVVILLLAILLVVILLLAILLVVILQVDIQQAT